MDDIDFKKEQKFKSLMKFIKLKLVDLKEVLKDLKDDKEREEFSIYYHLNKEN